jgi:hypothetical protein
MYTSAALFALSGLLAAAPVAESPTWRTDYSQARNEGASQHRPLAIFLGAGQRGWNDVSQTGKLGKEIQQLLAKHYICVYVDMRKRAGKQLADDLEMTEAPGIVISDASCKLQAFRHAGDLSTESLAEYLRRYADRQRVVQFTETNPSERASYYPPPVYAPAPFFPSGGGRSC